MQSGSAVGTLPTQAQRNGDFSTTYNSAGQVIPIYDPFTTVPDPNNPGQYLRTQYPGNKIPASEINPVTQAMLTYLPLPNRPGDPVTGSNNYYTNYSSPIIENSFSIRFDHAITDKQKIFGRYSLNDTTQTRPNLYGSSSPNFVISSPTAGNDFLRQQQATIDYTNPFKPNAILDLNSSYIRYFIGRRIPGYDVNPTVVGLPSYFTTLASKYTPCFPSVGVSGLGLTLSLGNIGGGLMGGGCYTLGDVYPDLHEYGSVTIVHGEHTFKTGGDFGIDWLATPDMNRQGRPLTSAPTLHKVRIRFRRQIPVLAWRHGWQVLVVAVQAVVDQTNIYPADITVSIFKMTGAKLRNSRSISVSVMTTLPLGRTVQSLHGLELYRSLASAGGGLEQPDGWTDFSRSQRRPAV